MVTLDYFQDVSLAIKAERPQECRFHIKMVAQPPDSQGL
jgi:hypothetical protein